MKSIIKIFSLSLILITALCSCELTGPEPVEIPPTPELILGTWMTSDGGAVSFDMDGRAVSEESHFFTWNSINRFEYEILPPQDHRQERLIMTYTDTDNGDQKTVEYLISPQWTDEISIGSPGNGAFEGAIFQAISLTRAQ